MNPVCDIRKIDTMRDMVAVDVNTNLCRAAVLDYNENGHCFYIQCRAPPARTLNYCDFHDSLSKNPDADVQQMVVNFQRGSARITPGSSSNFLRTIHTPLLNEIITLKRRFNEYKTFLTQMIADYEGKLSGCGGGGGGGGIGVDDGPLPGGRGRGGGGYDMGGGPIGGGGGGGVFGKPGDCSSETKPLQDEIDRLRRALNDANQTIELNHITFGELDSLRANVSNYRAALSVLQNAMHDTKEAQRQFESDMHAGIRR